MSYPKVAVLMSSYNGERYIREQIDSILAQKDVDVTLFVRDDGSTDDTVTIVRSYLSRRNIKLLVDGQNLRPGLSFLTLLKKVARTESEFDYYAFADQDDIWLEDKLKSAVDMIGINDNPVLYCSNQTIYQEGKIYNLRFSEKPKITLMSQLSSNIIYGCTMVMNRALVSVVNSVKFPSRFFLERRNHDAWVILCALVKGNVVYDHNSHIWYRIHSSNTVGLNEMSVFERIQRMIGKKVKNLRSASAFDLLQAFPNEEFTEREHIQKMADYRKSIAGHFALICDNEACKTKQEKSLLFCIKVMMNYI